MRKYASLCFAGLLMIVSAAALAQDAKSSVGTWKVDGPKPITLHIYKDTPQMLSWKVNFTDDHGKPASMYWSGPKDGSLHQVKTNDPKEKFMQSAKMEDGKLHRHGELSDGSSFDAVSLLSDDGNTITEETSSKDKAGKEEKSTTTYHKVKGAQPAARKGGK